MSFLKHAAPSHNLKRPVGDFYKTPFAVTKKLLQVEKFTGEIWEPACGDGAISKVLVNHGCKVISSDLFDRGYGKTGIDFLVQYESVSNVITNPPYKLVIPFMKKAIELAENKVAFLLQLGYLQGVGRRVVFRENPPSRVWVLVRRPGFEVPGHKKLRRAVSYAWFVWDRTAEHKTILDWID